MQISFRASATELNQSFGYQVQIEKGWKLQDCRTGAFLPGVVIKNGGHDMTQEIKSWMNVLKALVRPKVKQIQKLKGYLAYEKMLSPKNRRR